MDEGLRDQDLAELGALGRDPETAFTEGLIHSAPHAYSIIIDGRAAAMFGAAPSGVEGVGIVWMLGTYQLLQSKRELVVEARKWVIYLNSIYPTLMNAVDTRNTISINWLEVMGFTFGPDLPLPNGAVFRSFQRCANPSPYRSSRPPSEQGKLV